MPFSSFDHSLAVMIRGVRSSGNGRSCPDSENVMPWSTKARPRASLRAFSSLTCDGATDSYSAERRRSGTADCCNYRNNR